MIWVAHGPVVLVLAIAAAANGARPRWLEDPLPEDAQTDEVNGGRVFAVGERTALGGDPEDAAVIDIDRGLLGYLLPPESAGWVRWAGFGVNDAVLIADEDGTLYAARSPAAAVDGAFERRGAVPGASVWDAAHDLVAAVTAGGVAVSIDGGRSFRTSWPTTESIDRLLVRAPATVLVTTSLPVRTTWLSIDAGRTWRESSYQGAWFRRVGGWISDLVTPCPAVLRDDGTWRIMAAGTLATQRDRLAVWPRGWAWPEADYQPAIRPLTVDEPLPVVDEGPVADHPCRAPRPPSPPPRAPPPDGDDEGEGCCCASVADPIALQREDHVETATVFALADDGVCVSPLTCGGATDGVCSDYSRFGCAGPMLRAPHLVIQDLVEGTAVVDVVPEGCVPIRVLSARGLGILLCRRGDAIDLYTTDRDTDWAREGTFAAWAADLDDADVAGDGTVVLTATGETGDRTRAIVRLPRAVGAADSLWIAGDPDALGYRPLPGGRALAIEGHVVGRRVSVTLRRLVRDRPPALVLRTTLPQLYELSVRGGRVTIGGRTVLRRLP